MPALCRNLYNRASGCVMLTSELSAFQACCGTSPRTLEVAAGQEDDQMKPFTILSHNAFWFQGAPFPTDMPAEPDLEILKRLCAIYRKVNPNVICLQEIQNQEAFERVCEHLGMQGCYCQGKQLPQYGGAVFWQPGRGRQIRNSHGPAASTQRMWQIVEVNGTERRLRMCNIHLPSGRQLGRERAAARRIAEIEESIRSCTTEPDIIVGDFNEQPDGPASKCLESHGYVDSAVLSDCADVPTNIGQGRGDYVWIKRQMSNCLLNYGTAKKQELVCGSAGKRYLSDHYPLWIALEDQ